MKKTLAVLVLGLFVVSTQQAQATFQLPKVDVCHKEEGKNPQTLNIPLTALGGHLGHGDSLGVCQEPEPVDVCKNIEGNQESTPEGYTNNDGVCTEVVEEPTDVCDNLEGDQATVPEGYSEYDGVCTPIEIDEPPIEEVPPVVTPPTSHEEDEDDKDSKKFQYSQGPNGNLSDSFCQIEYHRYDGSRKVEVRYAEDLVFGNGFKTLTTKDDGTIELHLNGHRAKVEVRGRDGKTDWSQSRIVKC